MISHPVPPGIAPSRPIPPSHFPFCSILSHLGSNFQALRTLQCRRLSGKGRFELVDRRDCLTLSHTAHTFPSHSIIAGPIPYQPMSVPFQTRRLLHRLSIRHIHSTERGEGTVVWDVDGCVPTVSPRPSISTPTLCVGCGDILSASSGIGGLSSLI